MSVPREHPRLLVRLTLLSTAEGGRTMPIRSGYRPVFFFQREAGNDGVVELLDDGPVHPGECAVAHVRLLRPDLVPVPLAPGRTFDVREGARVVATGEILE